MFRRTYKYRLYPTRAQYEILAGQLSLCCELYNAALQERRDAYKSHQKSISRWSQDAQLKEIKPLRPELSGVYGQVLQDADELSLRVLRIPRLQAWGVSRRRYGVFCQ